MEHPTRPRGFGGLGSGTHRFRANMAHVRQSRPDSGLGFQVKVLKPFQVDPSSLGGGQAQTCS